jgi:hypothetical protein
LPPLKGRLGGEAKAAAEEKTDGSVAEEKQSAEHKQSGAERTSSTGRDAGGATARAAAALATIGIETPEDSERKAMVYFLVVSLGAHQKTSSANV